MFMAVCFVLGVKKPFSTRLGDAHVFNLSIWKAEAGGRRQEKQRGFWDFEASLVCISSSRAARAIE